MVRWQESEGSMTDYSFWLGDYGQEYPERNVSVTYSNFDYNEGLPDDEMIEPECRGYTPLPEERPADYGPIEFDIADLDDE